MKMKSTILRRCLLAFATFLSSGIQGLHAFNLSPSLYSSHTALSAACEVRAGAVRQHRGIANEPFGPVMQLSAARKGGKGGKGKKGGKSGSTAKKDGDAPRQTSKVLDTDKREYIYQVEVLPIQLSSTSICRTVIQYLVSTGKVQDLHACLSHGNVIVRVW
jgi:hypothetical protein